MIDKFIVNYDNIARTYIYSEWGLGGGSVIADLQEGCPES